MAVAKVAPIAVFGIFMGWLVVWDYVFDITVFASALALQRRVQNDVAAAQGSHDDEIWL